MSFAEKWSKWPVSSRAFFVLHIVLIVLMIPAFIIGFTFTQSPPDGFFDTQEEKDDYKAFTTILMAITLAGTITTFLLSAFSIFVVMKQSSGVFGCNACTSVVNMLVLIICVIIPLVSVGILITVCKEAKDDCYHCTSSDDHDTCAALAVLEGFDCYYTDEDYDYVCVETNGKLGYVVASFIVGIILEFTFSIISCVSCCAIKKGSQN